MLQILVTVGMSCVSVLFMFTQIALLTVGQSRNSMWSSIRKMRLTASNFGPVLAAINRNRCPNLIHLPSDIHVYVSVFGFLH